MQIADLGGTIGQELHDSPAPALGTTDMDIDFAVNEPPTHE